MIAFFAFSAAFDAMPYYFHTPPFAAIIALRHFDFRFSRAAAMPLLFSLSFADASPRLSPPPTYFRLFA